MHEQSENLAVLEIGVGKQKQEKHVGLQDFGESTSRIVLENTFEIELK